MSFRSLRAVPALLVLLACDEPRPWDRQGWRPEAAPQRIVAGSVLAAEVLLELDPGSRLAAVHRISADPRYSLVADLVGDVALVGAGPEELLSARPDLVVVDAYTRAETLALLGAANVAVVRTGDAHDFGDIAANIRHVGRVAHLDREAERLTASMRARLASIERAGRDLADWRVLSLDGALHTYGRGSLLDAVLAVAGARNVASEEGVGPFRKLDVEEVLAFRPDAIVIAQPRGVERRTPEWLRHIPGLELLPCVQRDRLVFVDAALLISTSHRLVDAAQVVQQQLRAWGKP